MAPLSDLAPLSFVPPVPTWGSGEYGSHEALVVMADSAQVLDPRPLFALLVELVGPQLATAAGPAPLQVHDVNVADRRKVTSVYGVVLDEQSLFGWWERAVDSWARLETKEVKCVLSTLEGGRRVGLQLTLSAPSDVEVGRCRGLLASAAATLPGWHAVVALGRGWDSADHYRRSSSVLGYGPVAVADSGHLDTVDVDSSLVQVTALGDGRTLLQSVQGVGLAASVAEIRRICWPGWGYRYASDEMAQALYFEGGWSPRSLIGLMNVEWLIHKSCKQFLRAIRTGNRSDTVVEPRVARLQIPTGDGAGYLDDTQRLVAAWRRGATALTPPRHIPADGFVRCDVQIDAEDLVLTRSTCSAAALDVLQEACSAWPRIYDTQAPGPIRWGHQDQAPG